MVTQSSSDDSQLLAQVLEVLAGIAPEVRDLNVDPTLPLREQLELDSMDHLHFLVGLKQRFGLDVPEAQYARMRRLSDLLAYLSDGLRRETSAAKAGHGAVDEH